MSDLQKRKEQKLINPSLFEGQQTGFEETYQETFKTPFLKILQALSPECVKSSSEYMEKAEPGFYCNSATKQLYKDINIIVLKVAHNLIAWRPNRGGFAGIYNKSEEDNIVKVIDGLEKQDAEGNDIVDTVSFFCVNIDDPSDLFIFPLSKASFKHATKFATRLRMLKINGKPVNAAFAGIWNIKTVEEKNEKGSWFTLGGTPEFVRFITEEEYNNIVIPALEILKKAKTDYSQMENKSDTQNVEY